MLLSALQRYRAGMALSPPAPRDVSIRRATQGDLDDVWPLVSAFASTATPTKQRFAQTYTSLLDDPRTLVVVAERAGSLSGYLLAQRLNTFFDDRPVVYVQEVMVAEGARRLGIGRALLQAAERWADGCGAAYVSLASRRAGDFYSAIGYDTAATFFKKPLD